MSSLKTAMIIGFGGMGIRHYKALQKLKIKVIAVCDTNLNRLENYTEGTPAYLALETQIEKTQARFDMYEKQGLLCGADGLPHLIADGRWSHSGEFMLPGIGFLYISGWIGWSGRSYLQYSKKTDKPNENEIIINVPVAIGMMSSSFLWPLAAWKELIASELLVPEDEITVSPR